jgi:predicted nucleic acid-binding protein
MTGFIADTMAVILWMEKRKMPQKSKMLFSKAEKNEVNLYVPAMVLAEIGYLSEKKKIEITLSDTIAYLNKYNILIHAIDVDVIKSAFEIIDIPELHDRLIAASGKVLGYPIVTNDPKIIASKFVSTVWD